MNKEIPLQYNFDGDLVDNRTPKQRRVARQATGYRQMDLFHPREVTAWVNTRPQMPAIARSGKPLGMALQIEDPRTDEQKALDLQRQAEERTHLLPQVDLSDTEQGRAIDAMPSKVVLLEGR